MSVPRPTSANSTSAIVKEGPVVHAMCRMCEKISVSTTAGARFVVSDKGDILSPKYAPEMTAPAAIAGDRPRPIDTPINATPRVPATVQELPVASAAIAQIRQLAAKNQSGLRSSRPK